MLLRTVETEFRNKNAARCVKLDGIYKCDQCAMVFVRRYCTTLNERHTYQFCSLKCTREARKTDGVLYVLNRRTWQGLYGVDNPSQSSIVKEKIRSVFRSRYGVNSSLNLPHVRAQSNSDSSLQKRHETMKRNGSYGKSQIEERFAGELEVRFEKVERQIRVNKWEIDFYVESIDTYIQFDGVYWHGLDRSIDTISEHRSSRDAVIHKTWLRDREQDKWFRDHGLRLTRVTDRQYKSGVVELLAWR